MSEDGAGMIMGAVVLTLFTIVLVTMIVQFASTWRARAQLAREDEYRRLANEAVASGSANAAIGQKLVEDMADIRARLTAVEKLLREVG